MRYARACEFIALAAARVRPRPLARRRRGADGRKTQVKWYGHAAFAIDTPSGKSILIDPWITNPSNPTGKDDVKTVKADLILVTHGHFDHVGDAARHREAHEGASSSRRSISATRSSARWAIRRTSTASTPAATSAARSRCSAARSRSRSSPRSTARRSAPIRPTPARAATRAASSSR